MADLSKCLCPTTSFYQQRTQLGNFDCFARITCALRVEYPGTNSSKTEINENFSKSETAKKNFKVRQQGKFFLSPVAGSFRRGLGQGQVACTANGVSARIATRVPAGTSGVLSEFAGDPGDKVLRLSPYMWWRWRLQRTERATRVGLCSTTFALASLVPAIFRLRSPMPSLGAQEVARADDQLTGPLSFPWASDARVAPGVSQLLLRPRSSRGARTGRLSLLNNAFPACPSTARPSVAAVRCGPAFERWVFCPCVPRKNLSMPTHANLPALTPGGRRESRTATERNDSPSRARGPECESRRLPRDPARPSRVRRHSRDSDLAV